MPTAAPWALYFLPHIKLSNQLNKSALRRVIREKRRDISRTRQNLAAARLLRTFEKQPLFLRAKTIGFYLANDGEISATPIMERAIRLGKTCYLPALTTVESMEFRQFINQSTLANNRFGIPEPMEKNRKIPPIMLDMVFVPLVAFDSAGKRLGMGGGYYDRTFAFKQKYPQRGPKLIGLAHSCQEVSNIHSDRWDIKMDFIVTDTKIVKIKSRRD